MKYKYYVAVFVGKPQQLMYVTEVDGKTKQALWKAGDQAKDFPEKVAESVAAGLNLNAIPSAIVKVPEHMVLCNQSAMDEHDDKLDVRRILTLSTSHIKQETADWLDDECEFARYLIVDYKEDCGWWIYMTDDLFEKINIPQFEIPEDLIACLHVAYNNKCEWLALDRDVNTVNYLPVYKW